MYKNLSSKSVEAYRSDLSHLEQYLTSKYMLKLDTVRLFHLEDYIAHLHDQEYSPAAIHRKISAMRQFYKFLYLEGEIYENPARLLKAPKFERTPIQPLSLDQIELLVAATDHFDHPHNLRLKALIELAFGAGLRVSELISIPYEAINHSRDYTMILGKGKKERLIPLTPIVKSVIKTYVPHRLFFSNNIENDFLFPSTGRTGHLTRIRFFQLLKQLAIYANLPPESVSPHIFRHSFAIALLRGGADLKSLQALLGHEKIDTVEIYTRITQEDLWGMIHEHHPLTQNSLSMQKKHKKKA